MREAHRDEEASEWDSVVDHAILHPPWRDILGTTPAHRIMYSPAYGPATPGEFQREAEEYLESRAGGGLWDQDEAASQRSTTRMTRRQVVAADRYDSAEMDAYVASRGRALPKQQLEVYYSFWRDRRSLKRIANQLNITVHTVRAHIWMLRQNAKPKTCERKSTTGAEGK